MMLGIEVGHKGQGRYLRPRQFRALDQNQHFQLHLESY